MNVGELAKRAQYTADHAPDWTVLVEVNSHRVGLRGVTIAGTIATGFYLLLLTELLDEE